MNDDRAGRGGHDGSPAISGHPGPERELMRKLRQLGIAEADRYVITWANPARSRHAEVTVLDGQAADRAARHQSLQEPVIVILAGSDGSRTLIARYAGGHLVPPAAAPAPGADGDRPVPSLLLASPAQPPGPGSQVQFMHAGDRDRLRSGEFGTAQAGGRDAAHLPAALVDPGDQVRIEVPPRSGRLRVREVTGVKTSAGKVQITTVSPHGELRARTYLSSARIEVILPARHPAGNSPGSTQLQAPRPGRPRPGPGEPAAVHAAVRDTLPGPLAVYERRMRLLEAAGVLPQNPTRTPAPGGTGRRHTAMSMGHERPTPPRTAPRQPGRWRTAGPPPGTRPPRWPQPSRQPPGRSPPCRASPPGNGSAT